MKKRLMSALAAGGLILTMLPGAAAAHAPESDVFRTCYDSGGVDLGGSFLLQDGTPAEAFAYARIMGMAPESQVAACNASRPGSEGVLILIILDDRIVTSFSYGTSPY